MLGKVGCLVNMEALLVGYLGGSVLKVDIAGAANKQSLTSGFGLLVMLGVYIFVSVPCTFQLFCGIITKLA